MKLRLFSICDGKHQQLFLNYYLFALTIWVAKYFHWIKLAKSPEIFTLNTKLKKYEKPTELMGNVWAKVQQVQIDNYNCKCNLTS